MTKADFSSYAGAVAAARQGDYYVRGSATVPAAIDLVAAAAVGERHVGMGFRVTLVTGGDSASGETTITFSYPNVALEIKTISMVVQSAAGTPCVIRLLTGAASIDGVPSAHPVVVQRTYSIAAGPVAELAAAASVTFAGSPANSVASVELMQRSNATFYRDVHDFLDASRGL
jgi:hypothetical protein